MLGIGTSVKIFQQINFQIPNQNAFRCLVTKCVLSKYLLHSNSCTNVFWSTLFELIFLQFRKVIFWNIYFCTGNKMSIKRLGDCKQQGCIVRGILSFGIMGHWKSTLFLFRIPFSTLNVLSKLKVKTCVYCYCPEFDKRSVVRIVSE